MPDFHISTEDISFDGSVLKALLFDEEGEAHDAEIDLNNILGNDKGSFSWGGSGSPPFLRNCVTNFPTPGIIDSAQGVSFTLESADNYPVLLTRLLDGEGDAHDADINLSERLSDINGEFHFE
ncbi:Cyanovirin-N [Lentithecium fluviatile CBS 122367]|uniref:Cyanovirin-N n=1 Tax=Lentithecium fluviatile CBS 122367 TaxID=1168545 RepID=A0A6G1IEE7_9PLEO|nr:Cyanovirin-N [Lentithecium fluviatile CBS 122367]